MPAAMKNAQAPAFFQGDSEDMVDRLIEASARKDVAANYDESLFGRALVPFSHFDDTLCTASGPAGKPKQGVKHVASPSRSPAREGANKRNKPRTSVDGPQSFNASPSNSGSVEKRPMASSPVSRVTEESRRNSFSGVARPNNSNAMATSPKGAAFPAALGPRACPGFFSSPKPELCPTPSMTLLLKAGNSCRSAGSSSSLSSACNVIAANAGTEGLFAMPSAMVPPAAA